jgi:hypothetical protein
VIVVGLVWGLDEAPSGGGCRAGECQRHQRLAGWRSWWRACRGWSTTAGSSGANRLWRQSANLTPAALADVFLGYGLVLILAWRDRRLGPVKTPVEGSSSFGYW